MKNSRMFRTLAGVLLATLVATMFTTQALAAGQIAGKVVMLVGQAQATPEGGTSHRLKKGDPVHVGETIETGKKCYMKLAYADGGSVLLRPDTALKINTFQDPAEEQGETVTTLLKGGMRSVTGAISKSRKENYKIQTPVATLGIRGTDFVMRLCQDKDAEGKNDCDDENEDGLYTSVYDGGTTLKNRAGSLDSDAGEHAYVAGQDVSPIRLAEQPKIINLDNLPNPTDDSGQFIEGNACGP